MNGDSAKRKGRVCKTRPAISFIVLPHTHAFMMMNDEVIQQSLYFLQNERFLHNGEVADNFSANP